MIALIVISFVLIGVYIFFFSKYALVHEGNLSEIHTANIPISILIVVRNEERNISKLIHSLYSQDYAHSAIELLFFDDDSTDQTLGELFRVLPVTDFQWKVFSGNELKIAGKKSAISFLLAQANGELLLFTDGDTIVPTNWASSVVDSFNGQEVQMVCGGVVFSNTHTFVEKLLAIEFAAMIQASLGAIRRHFPFMCNAANMAVRKSALQTMPDRKGNLLSSGDDTFLLQSITEFYGNRAVVANFKSLVKTSSPENIKEFFHQRIRWAGKSSKSFWKNSFVVALLVFSISLWLVFLAIFSSFSTNALVCLLIVFASKWGIDFLVLKKYRSNFDLFKGGLIMSVVLSFVYPWYVVITALFSLKCTYLWKGRMMK